MVGEGAWHGMVWIRPGRGIVWHGRGSYGMGYGMAW